jgi:hypothetical protein
MSMQRVHFSIMLDWMQKGMVKTFYISEPMLPYVAQEFIKWKKVKGEQNDTYK